MNGLVLGVGIDNGNGSYVVEFFPSVNDPKRLEAAQRWPGSAGEWNIRLPQRAALQFSSQCSSHPPRKPARRSPFTI